MLSNKVTCLILNDTNKILINKIFVGDEIAGHLWHETVIER